MARGILSALEVAGYRPAVVSALRSREPSGNAAAQQRLFAEARDEITRLTASDQAQTWRAWITYHNYYKAPDLIGPAVSRALGIPYLLIEATRARSRLTGSWSAFARAAEDASDTAVVIFYLTEHDAITLADLRPPAQQLVHLRPFLARDALPPETSGTGGMLSVGMMRQGDKLASYRIIAQTLGELRRKDWRLDIAGDGPARADVGTLMAPFGNRVRLHGALTPEKTQALMQEASLLLWPGVNEAFGMAYLEAQAAGLPVVAQDRPGVRDVLAPGAYPAPEAGAAPLAELVERLLNDNGARQKAGQSARAHIKARHLIGSAADTLADTLNGVMT
ncbi:glycosyltransferase family 4 protein [Roseobacter ponti]|uniref:Glycosyltransferase family 4 protein n=2 Tax=Roseobacter ponti TaxID=1891787 RepID=A0A858SYV3_9RHOB|nr:glycosyltransferase family 4 protein [Roseobacter ponti]